MVTSDIETRRAALSALGEQLRAIGAAAAETEAPLDVIAEATDAAAKLRALLDTDRRESHHMPSVDEPSRNVRFFSPVRGLGSSVSPPVDFQPTDDGMGATFTLDKRFEGFPGVAHGGVVAMIFDELLGVTLVKGGYWAMTAWLNVEYKRAIPVLAELVVRGVVTKREGRKTFIRGTLAATSAPDEVLATAESLMVQPRAELAARYFDDVVDPTGQVMAGRLDEELGNG